MVDPTVYVLTQADAAPMDAPALVDAALSGGATMIQLRETGRPVRERLRVGRAVRGRCRAADVPLVVNDRVDLAAALDADGVHLGDDDLPVPVARQQLGPDAVVGRSASTVEAARAAETAGADYVGVGAVYGTDTKPDATGGEAGVGPERVARVAEAVSIPVVAIGGITPETADEVVEAGADGVAVVSAVAEAEDPRAATRALLAAVATARDGPTNL